MKKYFTAAIALAAIAFVSVSYLAQAEHAADHKIMPSKMVAPTDAAVPPSATPPGTVAPVVGDFAKDHETCTMLSSAPSTEGAVPSDEMKGAEYKKCMMGKGHTEDEMKAQAPAAPVMEEPKTEIPVMDAPKAETK